MVHHPPPIGQSGARLSLKSGRRHGVKDCLWHPEAVPGTIIYGLTGILRPARYSFIWRMVKVPK